jgi:hypothetical protein
MEKRKKEAWLKIEDKKADLHKSQDIPYVDYPLRLDKRETTKGCRNEPLRADI